MVISDVGMWYIDLHQLGYAIMKNLSTPEIFFEMAYQAILLAQIGKKDLASVRKVAKQLYTELIDTYESDKIGCTLQDPARQ